MSYSYILNKLPVFSLNYKLSPVDLSELRKLHRKGNFLRQFFKISPEPKIILHEQGP